MMMMIMTMMMMLMMVMMMMLMMMTMNELGMGYHRERYPTMTQKDPSLLDPPILSGEEQHR